MKLTFKKPKTFCKYWRKCPHFKRENFTCNSYDAEKGYCGIYKEFKNYEEMEDLDL